MSRSDHHGCKPNCGVCHPEKKWKHQISRIKRLRISDQRRMGLRRKKGGY